MKRSRPVKKPAAIPIGMPIARASAVAVKTSASVLIVSGQSPMEKQSASAAPLSTANQTLTSRQPISATISATR